MKVFCIECKHFRDGKDYTEFVCLHPLNATPTWKSPTGGQKRAPSYLNKDNNCELFEPTIGTYVDLVRAYFSEKFGAKPGW